MPIYLARMLIGHMDTVVRVVGIMTKIRRRNHIRYSYRPWNGRVVIYRLFGYSELGRRHSPVD